MSANERTKSPPFKQRIEDAMTVARKHGYAHMRYTEKDGAVFEFDIERLPTDTETNDFDKHYSTKIKK